MQFNLNFSNQTVENITHLMKDPIFVENAARIQNVYCIDVNYSLWIAVSFALSLLIIINTRMRLSEKLAMILNSKTDKDYDSVLKYLSVENINSKMVAWFVLFNIMMFLVHFGLQPTIEMIDPLCETIMGVVEQ